MTSETHSKRKGLIFDIILVYVLLMAAYFRLVGLDWGDYQYLHPDERFLIWVGSDIAPIGATVEELGPPPSVERMEWRKMSPEVYNDCTKWGGYFDTSCSPLNPHNRGHAFYVYGTLPMFITRFIVEGVYGHSGFQEMTNIGRPLSALADLLTVFLVYLIAARIYDRRVGVLAAAFSALTVLSIQLSHYFTVDTFLNFFTYLAIYFAVRVAATRWSDYSSVRVTRHPFFYLSIAFGLALGSAVASKLNAAPVAVMLPAAFLLVLWDMPAEERLRSLARITLFLSLAAVVSILAFRIFQPYAFAGPGFFGMKINPMWENNIREQRIQAGGDVDFPPALQWARRSFWFSGENMVLWGLGLPLGLLAWAGFVWAGWRMLADHIPERPEFRRHILLWGWTGVYFVWQSMAFNPTMRYQLPVYPALAILGGWAVIQLWDLGKPHLEEWVDGTDRRHSSITFKRILALVIGSSVLLGTLAWAWAFSRIYVRPITRIAASEWIYQNVPGPINLHIQTPDGALNQPVPFPESLAITNLQPYVTHFAPNESGVLREIFLAHALDLDGDSTPKTLAATIQLPDGDVVTYRLTASFDSAADLRGQGYTFELTRPLALEKGVMYQLKLSLESDHGTLTLLGAAPANESTWDDGLPLRIKGYDGYGGIYQSGLVFEMYWDDNADKFQRIVSTLDQADYLFMSSNRQWGTIPRVPERYPLSSAYYRELLGCPPEKDIVWCYTVAQVGTFKGNLGFNLVQVFDSSPRLGTWVINDQFAEEAFTVYDHPKVFIFRKSAEYDPVQVRSILGAVDYTQAIHVTPKKAGSQPGNMMLPSDVWAEQQEGGTWSQLFDTDVIFNRYPALAAVLWYLSLSVLGWVVYPLVRLALPGLKDRGYPMARAFGLLLLSYLVWLAGSNSIPFNRLTISLAFGLMILAGGIAAWVQRDELGDEWRNRKKYFLSIELLFLGFFLFDLLIRLGNPDLWHPWKGGEKPMDFSYLNAVLKSTTFPPYDPWYAGGFLNYYYYGFVFVGVFVKWLGIVPAVAYNLIIPTIFAMIALGAYSMGWNIFSWGQATIAASGETETDPPPQSQGHEVQRVSPFIPAMAAALGMAVLGNLGTVRMIYQGYQRLAAPEGVIEGANILTRLGWAAQGFTRVLSGKDLPYGIGDWYWIPSRAIPAPGDVEPITEFPFFTVLYGDPHAHLFALPIALLALAFALSIVLSHARWKNPLGLIVSFILGGLAFGALYPVNLSDIYTYLPIGVVAAVYAIGRYTQEITERGKIDLHSAGPGLLKALGAIILLVGLSFGMFQPYRAWYQQAYGAISIWKGTHTPFWSYWTHWGLFLFVILTWMLWETREWMVSTPASSLRKLAPYRGLIQALPLSILVIAGVLTVWLKVNIAWFVLPLAAWAGVLLIRPGLPDTKRFILFLVGTGLVLTLMVEVVVVRGDIGRMNTVFKFYLQVWTLFAVCAAAALGWLLVALPEWKIGWRISWSILLYGLVFGAALFPVLGGMAKVKDRMTLLAPHTLDGLAFMEHAEYAETWGIMDLSKDYRAIRWMQENVTGSPVIVEANLRNLYRWGSRFSIYTGLPGVVGWEWHQQQQRASLPGNWVSDRIAEIETFYTTTDVNLAQEFLRKYNVRYIILGQQERGLYSGGQGDEMQGLAKFPEGNGVFWTEVYSEGDTVIYEVKLR
jgi:YYY domain-containing protein